ncbi:MAG: undecaprenyl-diphosphate phosphatase [Rhodobacteraceae bacterium]|nr:MAG: undecaprenyl-diphosphate phosphatase [Paracoccaceae bacterium]
MSLIHLLILAIIQGLTEFLPVSSSGHLILVPLLTGQPDQGQAIDVAVHIGTLGAVILYFWKDVKVALKGCLDILTGKFRTRAARFATLLIIATIPVIIAGLILKITGYSEAMRSIKVIGWAMLIFGIVLYFADQKGAQSKQSGDWNLADAIKMGLWQTLALIPGTSRSGITITAARQLGYSREDGARIAMLMSIPTIIASAVLLGAEVISTADMQMAKDSAIAAVFAFIAALFALSLMMKLLKTISFTPYVIYRIVLGVVLLWIAYS